MLPIVDKSDAALLGHCNARMGGLRTERFSWWTHWRELADYVSPRRYKWLVTPNQANRGSPINQRIIDNTATIALRVLAAGMMAGLTSPGRPWFKLSTGDRSTDASGPVKIWLDEVTSRMLDVFSQSNFYNALHTMYGDLGLFGTAPMIIYEDYEEVIRCYSMAAGEYYIANSARFDIDTLYREFVYTVRQVVDEFGPDNVSSSVLGSVQTGGAALQREVMIGHAIEPNAKYLPGERGVKGSMYREVFWEIGQGGIKPLRIRYYREKPFIAPRWDTTANDPYGRSPVMDALGDIKQLQVEQKRKAQGIDKMVNPPMVADAQLKNQPATTIPGGVTYIANSPNSIGFKPIYEVKPDLGDMMMDIKEVQQRIKTALFSDLFLMISQLDTVRTATEIDARREEKMIQLGPVLERFENEALDPAVDRVFAIMHRRGLLPPAPQELQGKPIQVEYISMLAQAQRAAATTGIERLAGFVGNLAAANPGAMDNVDWDEMINEYSDLLGVSPKIIVPLVKVLQMRQQRQQQQQQQQTMQTSMAAAQGAKTLSDADVGGGQNALSKMLGTAA